MIQHQRAGGKPRHHRQRAAAAVAAWLLAGAIATAAFAQDGGSPSAPGMAEPPVAGAAAALAPNGPAAKPRRAGTRAGPAAEAAAAEAMPAAPDISGQPTPGAPRKQRRQPSATGAEPGPAPTQTDGSSLEPAAATPPAAAPSPPPTMARWSHTVMIDRLCRHQLLHNEEDRLFGMISLAVRATIRYDGGFLSGDLIDDAAQDSLDALLAACPRLVATEASYRLVLAIEIIRTTTVRRMEESARDRHRNVRLLAKATAADLSEELTSREIDAWLDGLTPRERALALFLYASDVTPQEVAEAVGMPQTAMLKGVAASKDKLLWFFRQREDGVPAPFTSAPPIEYRAAGEPVAALLHPASGTTGATAAAAPAIRITGISRELLAGWSLLATVTGLAPGRGLDVEQPFLVETDQGPPRRLIVTASAEIGEPEVQTRRFLLKAYAIDGDAGGVGFHETLHFAAPDIENKEALRSLGNPLLSNIEIARCLWHDYGKAEAPGLCR